MKMVKSLLLGSAAGVVAIAGAQAADLPVKAKPVQYVKICSLYGAGFYYIPGTDTCIKIGGFVRAEYNFNANGSFNPRLNSGYDRSSSLNAVRSRIIMTADVRSQTEYGTLRAYANWGGSFTDGGGLNAAAGPSRAFIQFAGFTLGRAQSFFDFFSFARFSNQTNVMTSDSGGSGDNVFAYTAQLGNGWSATISVEDPAYRRRPVWDVVGGGLTSVGGLTNRSIGFNGWPDIVGNVHVDQSWGSAQVMGAIHQVGATYYSGIAANLGTAPIQQTGLVQGNGHPGDEVGWAAGIGLRLNLPALGKGDYMDIQYAYSQGATSYVANGGGAAGLGWWDGQTFGVGYLTDAVFNSGFNNGGIPTGLELTNAWNISAGYVHHWNSMWQTSIYGGYMEVNYGGNVDAWVAAPFSWGFYQVGSRTVWKPVKNLDLSVDVMYSHLDTAAGGMSVPPGVIGLKGVATAGTYTLADQDVWSFIVRAQRNFYP